MADYILKPNSPSTVDVTHPLSRGLSLMWPFNEDGGTKAGDASPFRNTGTIASSTWTPSTVGNVLDFDGINDCVYSDSAVNLRGSLSITVAGWFNITGTGSNQIVWESSTNYNSNNGALYANFFGGNNRFYLSYITNAYYEGYFTLAESTGWHHIVVVYNSITSGTGVVAYLDGAEVTVTDTFDQTRNATAFTDHVWYVGARANASLWTTATIKDFAVWHRGLNAQEARLLYLNSHAMLEEDDDIPLLVGATSVGAAPATGFMTLNTGYWG